MACSENNQSIHQFLRILKIHAVFDTGDEVLALVSERPFELLLPQDLAFSTEQTRYEIIVRYFTGRKYGVGNCIHSKTSSNIAGGSNQPLRFSIGSFICFENF